MNSRRPLFLIAFLVIGSTFLAGTVQAQSNEPFPSDESELLAEAGEEGAEGTTDHGESHEGGEEGHSDSSGWSSFWKPAVTQLLGFLLLVFVYVQWVHPLLKRMHEERTERIKSDFERIEQEKQELEEQEQEIEEKMATLEERAEEERKEILERGRTLKEETIEEAEQHAEETIQNAREEAKRIRERAVLEIQNSMTESALEALRKYFQEEAGEDLHRRFHQRLLDSMKEAESLDQFQRGDGDHMQEST